MFTFANSIDLNPIGAAATLPTRTFAVYNSSQAADAVTFNGNLSQGALALANAATIVKTGQGRLIFGAGSVLTYQGGTTVNDGILQMGAPNQLPSSTLLTVNSVAAGPGILSAGVLDMKGFSQSVGNLAGTGVDALVTSTGGAATLTFGSDATDQTYFGQINDGAGALDVVSLVKNGSGKSALWGNNDYSGTTIINGGTLLVDGTHTGGGAYTVTSGGTLGGTGTIDIGSNTVTIQSGGTLAPGNSPGILTINGDLTIDGTYAVDIGAFTNPNVLPTFDQTILTGPAVLALGSTSVLDAFNWQGMWDDFSTGTWYPIIKYTSMSGTFGSWNGVYAIDYAYHPVVGENWVAIQVPEPAALTLLALSGAAMLLRGRRRRR